MIRLAIVGTGGMAGGHALRFNAQSGCKVVACCDIQPGRAQAFAEKHSIPAAYENLDEMLKREAIDGVSIAASDRAHAPIALAAIRKGLPVFCEKPLADTLVNAQRMAAAAQAKKVLTGINFSYRNRASTQKAARILQSGVLGRILHVEGTYLQSWLSSPAWGDWRTTPAFLWRLSSKHGSLGVLGDIGVHLYDLTHFVVGPFAELNCTLQVFDKGVKRIKDYVFDANDSMVTTVRFANGALGVLHSTRWASGQTNTVTLRVYGEQGSIDLNLDRPLESQLKICLGPKALAKAEWKEVVCPKVPDMYTRFLQSLKTGQQGQTSFAGGLIIQKYLDASLKSAQTGKWAKIALAK